MCTSKLPEKASLWVPKGGQVKKLLRVSASAGSSLSSKSRMLTYNFVNYRNHLLHTGFLGV